MLGEHGNHQIQASSINQIMVAENDIGQIVCKDLPCVGNTGYDPDCVTLSLEMFTQKMADPRIVFNIKNIHLFIVAIGSFGA
jgi:hypothetical protein